MIEVKEIGVSFGGVKALDRVSLSCGAGEIIGVAGPSGSGKSTLLDAISGLHPLGSGSVSLGGIRTDGLAPHFVARHGLARMYQEDRLFGRMTAFENVLAGAHLRAESDEAAASSARAALESVGLLEHRDAYGWDLTAGERRRLALARALASSAPALVLDEPLRCLDGSELELVRALLARAAAESGRRAIVISDRDISMCEGLCDRVLVLHAGQTIAHGTFDEVVRDVDVRDAYLGVEWSQ
ncbi:MAG TPA: ATP-binding cassette domain-containing protein [Candidatus Eremiobacteraceae bacterium]|nr:ATP-binding cassette domain-containing protein [Candidatus Eremiobacteraceae bacterium]